MASAPEVTPLPDPRTEAGPARRALHLTMAGAGWILFSWWWILVLRRTSGAEVAFTATFLVLSLIVVVVVTSLWVAHNVSVFRKKGPRRTVRERVVEQKHDTLGRGLSVIGDRASLADSPIVRITLEGERKVYHPADAGWTWAPAQGAVGDAS